MRKDNDGNDTSSGLRKVSLVMEKFWLVLAILSLFVVCYIYITEGLSKTNVQYLVFPLLAGVMYGARTFMRRKTEGHHDA